MMSWDRKLRKLIAEQTKPRITFKEFCEKHGIELPANYVAQTNTNEKVNVFALRVTSLCVLGIAAIIAIMFVFIPKNNFQNYHGDMILYEPITYETFVSWDVPQILDFSKVEDNGAIYKARAKDRDLLLGYELQNLLYGFDKNGKQYAFTLTQIIRCYKGYLFTKHENFESLQYKFGDTCGYDIADNGAEAYVAVNSNGYEYFIRLRELGGITPITKENIEIFLQEIL